MYVSLKVKMERQKHKLPIESEWQEKVAEIVWFTASVFKTRQCIPHDTKCQEKEKKKKKKKQRSSSGTIRDSVAEIESNASLEGKDFTKKLLIPYPTSNDPIVSGNGNNNENNNRMKFTH
jgi:hypothetical protein